MCNLDWSTREVIGEFGYSNILSHRWTARTHMIGNRKLEIYGDALGSTFVGLLYKVFDRSVESFKYILHVGVETQDATDNHPDVDVELEGAYLNALDCPTIVLDLGYEEPSIDFVKYFGDLCNDYLRLKGEPGLVLTTREISQYLIQNEAYSKKYPLDWIYFNIFHHTVDQEG